MNAVDTVAMSAANRELADFLRKARGRVDPARMALPLDGRVRRVPGLRREEVAYLAGVSSAYYTRLEQGQKIIPSAEVVDAIATALCLDHAELSHLRVLLGRGKAPSSPAAPSAQRARASLLQFVDALQAPALVLGRRTEVLAANAMARALIFDFLNRPARERNYAAWVLLSPEARDLFVDWDIQARAAVESLRLELARDHADRSASELVASLSARSPDFARWWDEHGVYQRTYGTKRLNHPLVGRLDVHYETLVLPGDPDQTLFVYGTEPGTSSQQALSLLASWTLTPARDRPRQAAVRESEENTG